MATEILILIFMAAIASVTTGRNSPLGDAMQKKSIYYNHCPPSGDAMLQKKSIYYTCCPPSGDSMQKKSMYFNCCPPSGDAMQKNSIYYHCCPPSRRNFGRFGGAIGSRLGFCRGPVDGGGFGSGGGSGFGGGSGNGGNGGAP